MRLTARSWSCQARSNKGSVGFVAMRLCGLCGFLGTNMDDGRVLEEGGLLADGGSEFDGSVSVECRAEGAVR